MNSVHSDFVPSTPGTPFAEIDDTIPDSQKNGIYYFVIIFFILSAVTAIVLTGAFLVVSVFLWGYLKPMKFFWFLVQMTFSAFIVSAINFVFNVPATLFSITTESFVHSDLYLVMLYLIDFFLRSILFSNLAIAIQRFFVFFHSDRIDAIFNS
ncbi:unnamed protein product [Caenorhabditis nigoni]